MKHKIALFSDIHGNVTAFEAAIADARQEEITDAWILGDILMHGWGTSEIFELVDSLNPSVWVKGNWDDLLLMVDEKNEHFDVKDPCDIYIAKLGMDLLKKLSKKNVNTLRNRPLNQTQSLNGLTFSIAHNLPNNNSGGALIPTADQENFDGLFSSQAIDVAVYGHVHHQLMRYSHTEQLVINPGAVGYPFCARKNLRKEGRAHYAILSVDEEGALDVSFRQVKYEINQELERAQKADLAYFEAYQETLEKGGTRTHDRDYLFEQNQKFAYEEEVKAYLATEN
ncbi:hypothetical protein IGI37_003356 [Enterococcus sp. AZ194]|uniref:metallophosphoesterase family protein n=1 Tax=Enterococcus sp. AZ194 TaxID=2774629 RepID=UPI003F1FE04A